MIINQQTTLDFKELNKLLLKYKGLLYFPNGSLLEEEQKLYKINEMLRKKSTAVADLNYQRTYNDFMDLKKTLEKSRRKVLHLVYQFSEKKRKFVSTPNLMEKPLLGLSVIKCQELSSDKNALVIIDLSDILRISAFELTKLDVFLEDGQDKRIANQFTRELRFDEILTSSKFYEKTSLNEDEDFHSLKLLRFEKSDYTRSKDNILLDKSIICNYFGEDALKQDKTFYSSLEETFQYVTALYLQWFLQKIKKWRTPFYLNGIGEGYFILQIKKESVNRIRELVEENPIYISSLGRDIQAVTKVHSIQRGVTTKLHLVGGVLQ